MDRAHYYLLLAWTGNRKSNGLGLDAEDVHHWVDWRETEKPLQTAFLLSRAFLIIGGNEWAEWNRTFSAEMVRSQHRMANYGWWTMKSLGVGNTPEVDGMTAKESRIYATCLMLMSFPPIRNLPSFKPNIESDDPEHDDWDDIVIEYI